MKKLRLMELLVPVVLVAPIALIAIAIACTPFLPESGTEAMPGDLPNGTVVDAKGCVISNLQTGKVSLLRCTITVVSMPPTPTPSPTATPSPTPTPTPVPTPTPTPTSTPTPTPTPTPSPTPTATPTPTPTPGTLPPLPDQALWESNMKTKGKLTGDFLLAQTPGTDACLAPTYYDAESVFYQIGIKFPGEATWAQYAAKAEDCYRDKYLLVNGGNLPGYWVFPEGLRYDFDRTNDTKSRDAIHALATNANYCQDFVDPAWLTSASMSREVAYCLMSRVHDEQLGAPHSPRTDLILDKALGHASLWLAGQAIAPSGSDAAPECIGKNYIQPFMVGLTLRGLIQYEAWKHDARIPPVVKALVDYIQAQTYDPVKKALVYQNCTEPGQPGGPWIRSMTGAPDLNLLIVPAYAWLYLRTGDTSYITNGDQLWSGGVHGAYLEQGKQFNQNYTWSFRYPEWRAQAPAPIAFARVPTATSAVAFPKNLPKGMMPSTKP